MAITKGRINAISISKQRCTPKYNVAEAELKADYGIIGDAHAGSGHRQVSLLAVESIKPLLEKGIQVSPGDFAENIMTEGLDLVKLKTGERLIIDGRVVLEITQLGKRCHRRCGVYARIGDCIMPRDGVFARVITGGRIKTGDAVEVVDD